jgi:hypothetical protein
MAASAVSLLMVSVGCQSVVVKQPPLAQSLGGAAPEQRMEFWSQLGDRKVASYDDAFHAVLLYVDGTSSAANYDERVATLKQRGYLPEDFSEPADAAATRGDMAYVFTQAAGLKGGLTTRVFGPSRRYATRTLQAQGIYPTSSEQQLMTGGELISIIGKLEDYQRGSTQRLPAQYLPSEAPGMASATTVPVAARPDVDLSFPGDDANPIVPLKLAEVTSTIDTMLALQGQTAGAETIPLTVIITGVEGEMARARNTEADAWEKVYVGMELDEGAEIETGDKSAVRFTIPPGQTYVLDRLGKAKVLAASFEAAAKQINSEVGLAQGRLRLDVDRAPPDVPVPIQGGDKDRPIRVEAAGVAYDSRIRSANAALAVRGTKVSLTDTPGFDPEAASITGRAVFRNTRRQMVAFGGAGGFASVAGDQSSAAQAAFAASLVANQSDVDANDRSTRELGLLVARGGFQRGDVLVGDSNFSDSQIQSLIGGSLDFVLRWNGGETRQLNDLNLAVVSPQSTPSSPDFVANPPFTLSLTPGDPRAEAIRAERYPRTSRTGGSIGKNHVGPEGLEIASWSANYPRGTYVVGVFNLVDANPPPDSSTITSRVPYTVDVFVNRQKVTTLTGEVGELETQGQQVVINAGSGGQVTTASVRGASVKPASATVDTAAGTESLRVAGLKAIRGGVVGPTGPMNTAGPMLPTANTTIPKHRALGTGK